MKRTLRNIVLAGAITLASLFPMKNVLAKTQEDPKPKISASFNNNYASQYVLFGLPFSEGPVWQPTLNVGSGNLNSFLMANKDLTTHEWNEIDIGVDYNISLGKNSNLSLGTIYFPSKIDGKWKDFGTSYASLSSGAFSVMLHKIWGNEKGTYLGLTYSKDYPISDKFTFSNSTSIGYNDGIFRDKKGLTHFESSLKGSLALTDKLGVSGQVIWVNPLADDIKGGLCFRTGVSYDLTKKPPIQK